MDKSVFGTELIKWYKIHQRTLPWRETSNPYHIWLSEIILQQTRVDQGLSYYNEFISKYPTVNDLATASEDEVLRTWQGLGYYSRARNLHFTAKMIVDELNSNFPDNYTDLLKLKGVGEYTAAAIASFAFGQSVAVVDGNVFRVLARVFGVDLDIMSNEGKKSFQKLANQLITKKSPAEFNQSIMEFGALWCTPKSPKCDECPFQSTCIAFNEKRIDQLPVKLKKTKVRNRFFNYLLFEHKDGIALKRRGDGDIWQGLYDLPLIESDKPLSEKELIAHQNFPIATSTPYLITKQSDGYKHILSHQRIYATFWHIKTDAFLELTYYNKLEVEALPNPVLVNNYLKAFYF